MNTRDFMPLYPGPRPHRACGRDVRPAADSGGGSQEGGGQAASKTPPGPIRRMPDGKPDLGGF